MFYKDLYQYLTENPIKPGLSARVGETCESYARGVCGDVGLGDSHFRPNSRCDYNGPRHLCHLTLQNNFVNVFKEEVSPGDSIVLHRRDHYTITIAIGEQLSAVIIPGASRWRSVPVGRPSRAAMIWQHTEANGEPISASTQMRNPV
jgi:hypothetical protein